MAVIKSKTQPKKLWGRFEIDASIPAADNIFDIPLFEKYLHDRIKINGIAGKLGTDVIITRNKNTLKITSKVDMSKRYMKYLTKKFLKKNQLRDWIRVVADNKGSYQLKYYNINQEVTA
ncbi:hypothetical protein BB561_000232 [Smittium simulii]|uniref:Large ribosomal subunit protein eL22 n=1 Tax=Smittium simulii TaxID=133385 RepID=A0A2T9YZR4_9FUNG|nr:hypothetical protein BB561_000232 [Smittium simulii]